MDLNKVKVKKSPKIHEINDLESYSKEQLIAIIKGLDAHNTQLKNIISKTNDEKSISFSRKNKPYDFSKCTFRHVLLKFFYLGWDYQGYVTQEDSINTVEHHLFNALNLTCLIKDRASSNYHRCGRTDKGVSSFGQVISINLRSKLKEDEQENVDQEINYCTLLNKVLPENIQCVAWCPIENDFSARFDCKSRTYKYFFPLGKLNIEAMRKASSYLIGAHDFRNLCKMDVGNGVVQFVRKIDEIHIDPFENDCLNEFTMFVATIKSKAFLWHQIRCIMGILFLIGQNKEQPELILELLNVEKNPSKPDYNMASEIPLNLFHCEYEHNSQWKYDKESLRYSLNKLNSMWTFESVKTTMIKNMLQELKSEIEAAKINLIDSEKCLSEILIQGVKSKAYTPVMKRQKCDTLQQKIEHYTKRSKIELAK